MSPVLISQPLSLARTNAFAHTHTHTSKAHAEREWNPMSPVLIGPAAASSVATIGSAQKSMLVAAHAHFCVPCDYMNAASFITKASCSTGWVFRQSTSSMMSGYKVSLALNFLD